MTRISTRNQRKRATREHSDNEKPEDAAPPPPPMHTSDPAPAHTSDSAPAHTKIEEEEYELPAAQKATETAELDAVPVPTPVVSTAPNPAVGPCRYPQDGGRAHPEVKGSVYITNLRCCIQTIHSKVFLNHMFSSSLLLKTVSHQRRAARASTDDDDPYQEPTKTLILPDADGGTPVVEGHEYTIVGALNLADLKAEGVKEERTVTAA